MRNISIVAALVLVALSGAAVATPADRATAKEAEAMVKKAVAYIKANPQDKAFAEISDPKGQFVDRDLYLVVYQLDGVNLAHGYNKKFIGKNMIDLHDTDGKPFQRERMELARTKTSFWQNLKFVDPLSKKIEPKQTYCERTGEMVVCGGVYKQ